MLKWSTTHTAQINGGMWAWQWRRGRLICTQSIARLAGGCVVKWHDISEISQGPQRSRHSTRCIAAAWGQYLESFEGEIIPTVSAGWRLWVLIDAHSIRYVLYQRDKVIWGRQVICPANILEDVFNVIDYVGTTFRISLSDLLLGIIADQASGNLWSPLYEYYPQTQWSGINTDHIVGTMVSDKVAPPVAEIIAVHADQFSAVLKLPKDMPWILAAPVWVTASRSQLGRTQSRRWLWGVGGGIVIMLTLMGWIWRHEGPSVPVDIDITAPPPEAAPAPMTMRIAVQAIVWQSPTQWCVWINDRKILSTDTDVSLPVVEVTPDEVVLMGGDHVVHHVKPGEVQEILR
jgi:hypothetical protein